MENGSVVLLKSYLEDYRTVFSNFSIKQGNAIVEISFKPYDFNESYLIIVKFYLEITHNYTLHSAITINAFVIGYNKFLPQSFYTKEIDTVVEIVGCAYNNSRMIFYEQYKKDSSMSDIYLPFMFLIQIKELLATSDVYNKL